MLFQIIISPCSKFHSDSLWYDRVTNIKTSSQIFAFIISVKWDFIQNTCYPTSTYPIFLIPDWCLSPKLCAQTQFVKLQSIETKHVDQSSLSLVFQNILYFYKLFYFLMSCHANEFAYARVKICITKLNFAYK